MSELIVQVCEISGIENHPNADKLDVFTVKGWKIIANKIDDGNGNLIPRYKLNDRIVYLPPESIISKEMAEKHDVMKYLAPVKDEFANITGGRVRAIRLRGQPSYGYMFAAEDPSWEVGKDVAEFYGITKWEPPVESSDGDAVKPHSDLHNYTSIENIGNYPDIIQDGEEVILTEKIHGTNQKSAKIIDIDSDGNKTFIYAAGSHKVRRREFNDDSKTTRYWEPMTEDMRKLLDHLCNNEHNVIVYVELAGAGIQDLRYGYVNGHFFRAFDISVDGQYLNVDDKIKLFNDFNIPMVPILYRGPFSKAVVEEYTSGPTTICEPDKAGKFKGREGIVITPVIERYDFKIGRVILKSISVDYLARKDGTDSH